MKVFLTHGYYIQEDAREQRIMKPYPPLGLLYVAAHLRNCGHDVKVYDSTFGSRADLQEQLRMFRPGCIAIYVNLNDTVQCGEPDEGDQEHCRA